LKYNRPNKVKEQNINNQENFSNIQDILVKMATHYLNKENEKSEHKTG